MTCRKRWILLLGLANGLAQAQTSGLQIADLDRLVDVGEPDLSADGRWLAYSVTRSNVGEDRAAVRSVARVLCRRRSAAIELHRHRQ
jgi:hypothetical protein